MKDKNYEMLIVPVSLTEMMLLGSEKLVVYYDEEKTCFGIHIPALEKYHLPFTKSDSCRDSTYKKYFRKINLDMENINKELTMCEDPIFHVYLNEQNLIIKSSCINAEALALENILMVPKEATKKLSRCS